MEREENFGRTNSETNDNDVSTAHVEIHVSFSEHTCRTIACSLLLLLRLLKVISTDAAVDTAVALVPPYSATIRKRA